jgi:hypothetical protein
MKLCGPGWCSVDVLDLRSGITLFESRSGCELFCAFLLFYSVSSDECWDCTLKQAKVFFEAPFVATSLTIGGYNPIAFEVPSLVLGSKKFNET